MGITELAETVRAGLDRDAADIEQAWQVRGFNSERLTTMQGTTVLVSGWRAHRDLAAKRQLLDQALGWRHDVHDDNWFTCHAATDEHDGGTYAETDGGEQCTCGRDERVHAVLTMLATPYQDGARD